MAKETYFGQMVKKERNNHNETMQQLADSIGAKKTTVSMWENGGVVPKEDFLVKIANHYNVSVDYLLGNDQKETKDNESETLKHLQRGLKQMNEDDLNKAEKLLQTVFDDLFDNPGDDINGI